MSLVSLLPFVAAAGTIGLSVAILVRRNRSLSDWTFSAGMLSLGASSICGGLSAQAQTVLNAGEWQQWKLVAISLQPSIWLLFSLSYARGNARTFIKRWRFVLAAAFLIPVGLVVAVRGDLLQFVQSHTDRKVWILLGPAGVALHVIVLTAAVVALMNLERTFRASVGTMRWRIKFTLLGVGVLLVAQIYTSSQALLFHGVDLRLENINAAAILVITPLIVRGFYRAGRFETQVYPSQMVLQSSFTVLFAGIYLLLVGVFAKIAAHLGGDAAFALKAFVVLVALVSLAMLLQSDRVRLQTRRFVSRHFQRPLYDYRAVWLKFTEGTVSRVKQMDLCRSLVRLIADMFSALSVTIWLVDEKKEVFQLSASTSISEAKARELNPRAEEAAAVIQHFLRHPEPVDIEFVRDDWAEALRRWQPSEFVHGGDRVCVPLIGRGEVLGLIIVGDRVSGVPFSLQDFDMLKCVADHSAANLLNVQLSQKLLQAKELEAFQTMAAFFVHDLKNAASTLNLMLQNLPIHYDDPEFRADALRGISKTVNHINRLTSRLGMLRHELKIQPAERDLNEVVGAALASFETAAQTALTKDLAPVAKTLLDQEQLQKVITNLILNATEAVSPETGKVHIATSQNNGWLVLTVADNGCGMTDEFMRKSLFRPFQTTKKHGLGIGMFQSRMIVEAHGGRMAVNSEVGKGTTFQVFLPVLTANTKTPSPADATHTEAETRTRMEKAPNSGSTPSSSTADVATLKSE